MKSKFTVSTLFLVGLLVQGCAHSEVSRRLDEKLASETAVQRQSDLQAVAGHLIETTQGLTESQRTELRALGARMRNKASELNQRSLRLRSVLIRDLVSKAYDMDEVELIKSRLSDLENERVTTVFESIRHANEIMGRSSPQMKDFWETFLLQPN